MGNITKKMKGVFEMKTSISIAVAIALALVCFSAAAQGNGDLDLWIFGDHVGLPSSVPYEVYGVAMLDGSIPCVFIHGEYISEFYGTTQWFNTGIPSFCEDMAEGADGKIWLKYGDWYGWTKYLDLDGLHECAGETNREKTFVRWACSVDVINWRGCQYLALGGDDSGAYNPWTCGFASYCSPSCDEFRLIGELGSGMVTSCASSGDFIALRGYYAFTVVRLPDFDVWDLGDNNWGPDIVGSNSYFWTGSTRLDARARTIDAFAWADRLSIKTLKLDWRGLWAIGELRSGVEPIDGETIVFIAYWSLQGPSPEIIRWVPEKAGHNASMRIFLLNSSRHMTFSPDGALWFATDRAVCRWTLDDIPMPYEARVQAEANEGGAIEVGIEFDNRRIIRNDATLHLDIEFFADGQDEPLPGTLTFDIYFEFQPQETFTY